MKFNWSVRTRVLLVAVLPMLVVALFLTMFYTQTRLDDIEAAHALHSRAHARQLVAASQYATFSGNYDALQQLVQATLSEEGITGVQIVDLFGEVLASSGALDPEIPLGTALTAEPNILRSTHTIRVIKPIPSSLDGFGGDSNPPILGNVLLDHGRHQLNEERAALLRTGALTALAALIFTLLLASSMSRSVSTPIQRIAEAVSRIGKGRFEERVPIVGSGSLRQLAEGVNKMAEELAGTHASMRAHIEAATAELRTRKEEAERANSSKSRFLAAASHDLRQPMHALGLFISELSQCSLDDAGRSLLRQVTASARAMEDLLDSLLDISHLDAGALEPSLRAFPLQPIFERLAATQHAAAADNHVTLRIRPTEAWCVSDPVLFERILNNLTSNAVRYSPGGKVLVACRRRRGHWRIEVHDNGIGIPPEAQAMVFQEFVQLQNPERARDKGLGLGLAIVRRLTDLLGHPLTLRSSPQRGSSFTITVPASTSEDPENNLEDIRRPGDLGGLCVAILDNDPLVLEAMTSLLESWGCEVCAALDPTHLIDQIDARGRPPHAFLSDYRLAHHTTGAGVIRALRFRYGADLPAALITGDTGPEAVSLAEREGLPVLLKPVRPARLRALLNRFAARNDQQGAESDL